MTVETFLKKLQTNPDEIDFNALMELIDTNYDFTPTAFDNGNLHNAVGENSGSCKLFSFAKLHNLSQQETLACFGEYYRKDVLQQPESDNHQNIRNFIKTGWKGVFIEKTALLAK